MKKKLLIPVLALAIGTLAACGTAEKEKTTASEKTEEKQVLVVGTSADYAPFEFVDTAVSDEIVGFDIDLANLIATELDYELEFVNADFNSLIPGLQADKYDVVIAGMTPTKDRDEVVDFSIPYYETEQYMVFPKDSDFASLEDLSGKLVGAQVSSIQEELAKTLATEHSFKVESRNLIPELIQELKNDRFQGAVIENIVAENYLSQNDDLASFPIEVEDPDFKSVVFQENSELKGQFDEVIQKLIDEGKIDELKKKWFVVEE